MGLNYFRMEWPAVEVFKIIALYKQFECLWNISSNCYKRLDLKKNAWEEIATNMAMDVEDVKKKIKHLRTAYGSEKKKIANKRSGMSAEEVYIPNLYYYSELSFLDTVMIQRKTSSNLTVPIVVDPQMLPEENQEKTQQEDILPPKKPERSSKKRKAERDDKFSTALEAIINIADEPKPEKESIFSSFGKSVINQLESLSFLNATSSMTEIQKILTGYLQIEISGTTVESPENAENLMEMDDFEYGFQYMPLQQQPSVEYMPLQQYSPKTSILAKSSTITKDPLQQYTYKAPSVEYMPLQQHSPKITIPAKSPIIKKDPQKQYTYKTSAVEYMPLQQHIPKISLPAKTLVIKKEPQQQHISKTAAVQLSKTSVSKHSSNQKP